MDATIFFKNGDPSEPKLNAEGSFNKGFQGSFADEKTLSMCGAPKEEETFGFSIDDILSQAKQTASSAKEGLTGGVDALSDALKAQGESKISTGAWIAIGASALLVFGGLGYILYKKYK